MSSGIYHFVAASTDIDMIHVISHWDHTSTWYTIAKTSGYNTSIQSIVKLFIEKVFLKEILVFINNLLKLRKLLIGHFVVSFDIVDHVITLTFFNVLISYLPWQLGKLW
jgi:hypothetical protein